MLRNLRVLRKKLWWIEIEVDFVKSLPICNFKNLLTLKIFLKVLLQILNAKVWILMEKIFFYFMHQFFLNLFKKKVRFFYVLNKLYLYIIHLFFQVWNMKFLNYAYNILNLLRFNVNLCKLSEWEKYDYGHFKNVTKVRILCYNIRFHNFRTSYAFFFYNFLNFSRKTEWNFTFFYLNAKFRLNFVLINFKFFVHLIGYFSRFHHLI